MQNYDDLSLEQLIHFLACSQLNSPLQADLGARLLLAAKDKSQHAAIARAAADCIPGLVAALGSQETAVWHAALQALDIATEYSRPSSHAVVAAGGVRPAARLVLNHSFWNAAAQENGLRLLSSLVVQAPGLSERIAADGAIPALAVGINAAVGQAVRTACYTALAILAKRVPAIGRQILTTGVVPAMLRQFAANPQRLRQKAADVLGSIASHCGDRAVSAVISKANVMSGFQASRTLHDLQFSLSRGVPPLSRQGGSGQSQRQGGSGQSQRQGSGQQSQRQAGPPPGQPQHPNAAEPLAATAISEGDRTMPRVGEQAERQGQQDEQQRQQEEQAQAQRLAAKAAAKAAKRQRRRERQRAEAAAAVEAGQAAAAPGEGAAAGAGEVAASDASPAATPGQTAEAATAAPGASSCAVPAPTPGCAAAMRQLDAGGHTGSNGAVGSEGQRKQATSEPAVAAPAAAAAAVEAAATRAAAHEPQQPADAVLAPAASCAARVPRHDPAAARESQAAAGAAGGSGSGTTGRSKKQRRKAKQIAASAVAGEQQAGSSSSQGAAGQPSAAAQSTSAFAEGHAAEVEQLMQQLGLGAAGGASADGGGSVSAAEAGQGGGRSSAGSSAAAMPSPAPPASATSAPAPHPFDPSLLSDLCCPITHEPMADPVVAADGGTYERAAIEAWIARQAAAGQAPTSPLTGARLQDMSLHPNLMARGLAASLRAAGLLQ